jgi:hypothetical protein
VKKLERQLASASVSVAREETLDDVAERTPAAVYASQSSSSWKGQGVRNSMRSRHH